jgi:biopolymer transport protein ExbD
MLEAIRRRRIHHELPQNTGINMTPLLDVIFQLILFLMLTSSLARPNQVELDLPESTSGLKSQEDPDVICITYRAGSAGTEILLNEQAVADLAELKQSLQRLKPASADDRRRVDIQIARQTPYQDVISLIDTVRDAGFPRFSLLTLAPSGRKPL